MKKQYHQKALKLSLFTVSYNVVEGLAALIVGTFTNSTALVAFALDSFVESLSASTMIWRFAKHRSDEEEDRIEKKAFKIIGYSFLILGAYILYEAVTKLIQAEEPDRSLFGMIVAIASLIIMPILFKAKYRLGKQIGSQSLVADSKQTLACVVLSAVLLVGTGLNYFFGLWWADPVAAILIALFLLRENWEMRKGEGHH
jgi:cation diffusion facilitator family transporter